MWKEYAPGLSLEKLAFKLNMAKVALKKWNKNVFGGVDQTIKALKDWLACLDDSLQIVGGDLVEHEVERRNWRYGRIESL